MGKNTGKVIFGCYGFVPGLHLLRQSFGVSDQCAGSQVFAKTFVNKLISILIALSSMTLNGDGS
jgi:hypothetical protein